MDEGLRRYTHVFLFFVGLAFIGLAIYIRDPMLTPISVVLGICFIFAGVRWTGSKEKVRQLIRIVVFLGLIVLVVPAFLYWLTTVGVLNQLTIFGP